MSGIRIRSDGVELELADESELASMRSRGLLDPRAERWDGQRWRPLAPTTPVPAADPWSAWNEAADAPVPPPAPAAEVDELPLAALTPMPKAIVARPLEVIPEAALVPLPDGPAEAAAPPPRAPATPARAPVGEPPRPPASLPPRGPVTEPPRLPSGELIDFPRRTRPAIPLPAPAAEPVPAVRPLRVLGMAVALLAVVGGAWALAELTRPLASPVVSVGRREEPVVDPLAGVEAELRAATLGPIRPVREPGHLEDALLLDLQQLGVAVVSIRSPITRWTGRKRDDPAEAQVHVVFRPGADLNRDLGAIALAVGRYKLHYTLRIDPFEVIAEREGGPVATELDPARAERFAQGRVSLGEMLAAD